MVEQKVNNDEQKTVGQGHSGVAGRKRKVKSLRGRAEELGYSVSYCSRVLRGERSNPELLGMLTGVAKSTARFSLEGRNSTAELLPQKS